MSQTSISCSLQSGEQEASGHPSGSKEVSTNCVLVLDNAQLVGILTERDIVRLIAESRTLAELTVASVMSQHVITLRAEDNQDVFSALHLMRQSRIRHLPVVDKQEQVLGLLTPRRLRSRLEPTELMKLRQVHEVMTSTIIHARPTDSVLKVTQMMTQHQLSCVVIAEVSGASKSLRPIGILTEGDILQCHRFELNLEHTQAQDVMSTLLSLVNPEDSLWTVHKRMQHDRVRRVIVANLQGELQGIVTQSQLLPTEPEELYELLELLQKQNEDLQVENAQLRKERLETLGGDGDRQTANSQSINAKLRDANQRLAFHVENSPLAVVEWDSQFRVQRWSSQAENIFGWSAAEVLDNHWKDWHFVLEADLDAVKEITDDLLKGRAPHNISRNRNYTKAGMVIDCEWYNSALLDDSGNLISILSLAQDVTARNQADVALKESEERFRYLADHAPVLIWIAGCDKLCFHFNKHWLDFTGRTMEQELGNGWAEGVHPDDLQYCLDTYNQSFDARQSFEMEYRLRRFDGEYRWVLDIGVPRFDTNQEFSGYIGSCIDISDRKESEQLLQDSEQRYHALTDAVQHMIWVANSEGLSYNFNEQCQIYLGMTVAEIQGHGWANAVHPDDEAFVLAQWQESLQNTTPFDAKYRIRRSDGIYRWHVVRAIPRIVDGHVQEWIGSCTDIDDFMQAEAALRESDERQVLALDASVMGVWDWHILTNNITWSGHHYELFGLTPETFDGSFESFMNCVHPEDHALIFEAIDSSQQNHTPYEVDFRVIWPDGSLHHMSARGKSYYSDDGEPLRMLGMVMDISDRKQAEIALQQQALIFESITDGAFLTDPEGYIIDWNPAAERMYGYTKAEVLGQTPGLLHRPEESEILIPQIFEALASDGHWAGELSFFRKDGTTGVSKTVVVPLLDQKGEVVATIGLNHDITQRQKAEQQIYKQAALLDITTDATMVRSLDHQIIFWNRGAEILYGWTAAEVMDRNVNDLLYQEPLRQLEEIQNTLMEKGQWQGELQQVSKTGQAVIVDSRWTLVRDKNEQPDSILVVNTNITEKKQLKAQYLRAQRLESIGTLAGGIAHDLNNILTPIVGIAGLLKLKIPQLDQQSRHLIEMMQVSADRGADLVRQVLSFSRGIEGERMVLQVGHLISEVKNFAEKTFPKTIELHINLPNNLKMVSGDATQLHQVLMNLCVNARDAMPDGGSLSLSAENFWVDDTYAQMYLKAEVGSYVMITVVDNGVGMTPETLERIFDPFFTTKEVGKGTGLGLSTVTGIIKSHGGFVTVDSQVGNGTTFVVYSATSIR